ncbi:MAG: HDOD domain-containing protein [Campylobacterales bacterium]|nr:HDOD domain-containing protein [Campylobacterales bacterium]
MNKELETGIKALPPLPESVGKIQAICSDVNAGIGDLANVVSKDPMLTANLLKASNSPLYGFSREINNVTQAVSLFGMATVKGFALSSAVKSGVKIDLSPYGIDADRFAIISQEYNALMSRWYKKIDNSMMEILAPASFLIGVGQIIIANQIIEDGKKDEFFGKIKEAENVNDVENEYFNTDSTHVAAAIFNHWRFEYEMVESIKHVNNPAEAEEDIQGYAKALQIVKTAISYNGVITDASQSKAVELATEYGLQPELLTEALESIRNS